MRIVTYISILALVAGPAITQEGGPDCQAILDEILAKHPMNYQSCAVEIVQRELPECEAPQSFNSAVPTSHMILAIDASGSMAGRVGGETKMEIAKREALNFLRDIPNEVIVGLVVYGHKGNNQDSGKAESCAASELVHTFGPSRYKLEDSIRDLSPTGWTPLGGVLEFSADVIAELKAPRDGDLAPVVYLISDGEETCDGDPVGAAKALYEAGVQTTVNTIGFDVDAETAAQLEAIAAAAGGIYYPARDARSLRSQLDAIKEAEAAMARYQYCVDLNLGQIALKYHNARIDLVGCYGKNDPVDARSEILNLANRAEQDGTPEAVCSDMLSDYALDMEIDHLFLSRQFDIWNEESSQLLDDYREEMRLDTE